MFSSVIRPENKQRYREIRCVSRRERSERRGSIHAPNSEEGTFELRTRDAEAAKIREQEKEQYEEIPIRGADKKAAIGNAKLEVFEPALLEQVPEEDFGLPEILNVKTEERSSQWVQSSPSVFVYTSQFVPFQFELFVSRLSAFGEK